MNTLIGKPQNRVDGRAKVTGAALYAAEHQNAGTVHAVLVGSSVPSGALRTLDTTAAERSPGVLAVYSHGKHPAIGQPPNDVMKGAILGESHLPFVDRDIRYQGQYIAMVVAETLEQAQYAATCIRPQFERAPHAVIMEAAEETRYQPEAFNGTPLQVERGDVKEGQKEATVRVDVTYETPGEHPNPMEPHATTAVWSGGEMKVYDSTQWVMGTRNVLAGALNLPAEKVRVLAPYVGGMFGAKAATGAHVMLTALASRDLNRPVKTVLTREQVMTNVGARSRTIQRFQIGAAENGKIVTMEHDTTSQTSKADEFSEPCNMASRMLYDIPHYKTSHDLVRVNTFTPAWMRAPGEAPCQFAQECALDELAYALKIDPIELRRRNYAAVHPHSHKPFSNKFLLDCYTRGAELMDWQSRNPEPGSMRDGRVLIGRGMATATYPGYIMGATVRVRLSEIAGELRVVVSTASIDVGTGTYTLMAMTTADGLGLPIDAVTPDLGDTTLPMCAMAGGSNLTASVTPAIAQACEKLRKTLAAAANISEADAKFENGRIVSQSDPSRTVEILAALRASGKEVLEAQGETKPIMMEDKEYAYHSFGAQFAEVRIDPVLRTIRMSHMVGVFNCGLIVNPKAARSQLLGGMTFGIGMALLEELVYDQHAGRAVNADLADYMLPVNADIPRIDVEFVGEPDYNFNSAGVRGVGEIGNTGAAAAIVNAVYHATGKRVRKLPVLIESIL